MPLQRPAESVGRHERLAAALFGHGGPPLPALRRRAATWQPSAVSPLPEEPSLDARRYDVLVDARGLSCPMPLVKARQALMVLESGNTVCVLATDPATQRDFEDFSDATGHRSWRAARGRPVRHRRPEALAPGPAPPRPAFAAGPAGARGCGNA